jgi:hypothetical protein
VLQAIRSLPAPKDISRDAGALDTEEDGGSTPPAPTFTPSTSAFGSSRTSLDNGGRSGPRRWSPSSCASELAQHAPRLRCQHQVALLVIQPQCTSLRPGETPIGTALSPRLPIGMRSQVQVLAGPPTTSAGQSVAVEPAQLLGRCSTVGPRRALLVFASFSSAAPDRPWTAVPCPGGWAGSSQRPVLEAPAAVQPPWGSVPTRPRSVGVTVVEGARRCSRSASGPRPNRCTKSAPWRRRLLASEAGSRTSARRAACSNAQAATGIATVTNASWRVRRRIRMPMVISSHLRRWALIAGQALPRKGGLPQRIGRGSPGA